MEPEDVTVWQLWPVVPRGLHAVSHQAVTVRGQVGRNCANSILFLCHCKLYQGCSTCGATGMEVFLYMCFLVAGLGQMEQQMNTRKVDLPCALNGLSKA